MDQLIAMITEKTGLSADKAEEVVGMVIAFGKTSSPGQSRRSSTVSWVVAQTPVTVAA